MVDLAGGHQAEQRPGRLRRRARGGFIAAVIELVARPVFAPAAVGILDLGEPRDRLAEFGRALATAALLSAVSPICASIETQRAVTSSVGGSSKAPWSANGMLLR